MDAHHPHLKCTEGDVVYVRAVVVEAASDFFKIRVQDQPNWDIPVYVPVSEIAKFEDIPALRAPRKRS